MDCPNRTYEECITHTRLHNYYSIACTAVDDDAKFHRAERRYARRKPINPPPDNLTADPCLTCGTIGGTKRPNGQPFRTKGLCNTCYHAKRRLEHADDPKPEDMTFEELAAHTLGSALYDGPDDTVEARASRMRLYAARVAANQPIFPSIFDDPPPEADVCIPFPDPSLEQAA